MTQDKQPDRPLPRNTDGTLAAFAWPGGYPIIYLTRDGLCICPACANREVDDAQAVVASDIHWEGEPLTCDDCGKDVESAYGVVES